MELFRLAESEGPSWLHSQKRGKPNPQQSGRHVNHTGGKKHTAPHRTEPEDAQQQHSCTTDTRFANGGGPRTVEAYSRRPPGSVSVSTGAATGQVVLQPITGYGEQDSRQPPLRLSIICRAWRFSNANLACTPMPSFAKIKTLQLHFTFRTSTSTLIVNNNPKIRFNNLVVLKKLIKAR